MKFYKEINKKYVIYFKRRLNLIVKIIKIKKTNRNFFPIFEEIISIANIY